MADGVSSRFVPLPYKKPKALLVAENIPKVKAILSKVFADETYTDCISTACLLNYMSLFHFLL